MHNNIQTTIQSSKTKVGLLFALTGIVSLIAITFGFYSLSQQSNALANSYNAFIENGQICVTGTGVNEYIYYDGVGIDPYGQELRVNQNTANSTYDRGTVQISPTGNKTCFFNPEGNDRIIIKENFIEKFETEISDSPAPSPEPLPTIPAIPIAHQPSGNITLSTESQVLTTGQVCAYNVPANHLVAVGLSEKGSVNHVKKFERGSNGGNVCFGNEIGYHFHFFIYNKDDGSLVTEGTVW